MIKKTLLTLIFTIAGGYLAYSQSRDNILGQQKKLNAIRTTVPFLTIAPDSRAGAMGDAGVATSPDVNSEHWNAAKYVFMKDRSGLGVSYTPWLRSLGITDLNLGYLAAYHKFDDKQVVSGGLRYFNLGTIQYTDNNGNPISVGKPNEFAVDAGYSRMFSDYFSGGLVFRFIYSDIAGGSGDLNNIQYNPGISFAADLCAYYQHPLEISGTKGEMAFGLDISNIGSKMSYSSGDTKEFIPTDMRLGGRLSLDIDDYNSISVTLDLNKLLVPTPPVKSATGDTILAGKSSDVGIFQGMIQSFYDAPGGYKEELQEIMYSAGAEYWYRKQFAIRAGYFHEAASKGNRKYFSAGVGFKLNVISLDFSYLIPAVGGRSNPLANTMRFTIGFNLK